MKSRILATAGLAVASLAVISIAACGTSSHAASAAPRHTTAVAVTHSTPAKVAKSKPHAASPVNPLFAELRADGYSSQDSTIPASSLKELPGAVSYVVGGNGPDAEAIIVFSLSDGGAGTEVLVLTGANEAGLHSNVTYQTKTNTETLVLSGTMAQFNAMGSGS